MRENTQTPAQPQFNYVTMMVPVPMPTAAEEHEKKQRDVSVVGAFFWAIIILLAIWFITSGYSVLQ
jgi:hypothetical protein